MVKKLLKITEFATLSKTAYFPNCQEYRGSVPTKDMQTPPLSFYPTFMKDVQCLKRMKKTIFRFFAIFIFHENSSKIDNF